MGGVNPVWMKRRCLRRRGEKESELGGGQEGNEEEKIGKNCVSVSL